ncbi:helix-turn-helix domain-containing protein [Sphingobacterium sp. 1.A.4]|uniref:helix-turn-helix domain-containing protein n=1 Tax=Sphingobacterium sp. 1.A.4 TaxID=2044603 RepID=UPI000C0C07B7|nr:helix-turn-helix domain-containing protein [Sphingobacterium sp. 1.A.4]
MNETTLDNLVFEVALLTSEIRGIRKDLDVIISKNDTSNMISANELSKRLGLSVAKVMSMAKEKTIPHKKAGSRYLFNYNEALKSLEVKQRK